MPPTRTEARHVDLLECDPAGAKLGDDRVDVVDLPGHLCVRTRRRARRFEQREPAGAALPTRRRDKTHRPDMSMTAYPLRRCSMRGAHSGTGSRATRSDDVRYLLMIYMNPSVFETLSEEEQTAVMDAHDEFQKPIRESGELVAFAALADPSNKQDGSGA
jgi:hypothetical protein